MEIFAVHASFIVQNAVRSPVGQLQKQFLMVGFHLYTSVLCRSISDDSIEDIAH